LLFPFPRISNWKTKTRKKKRGKPNTPSKQFFFFCCRSFPFKLLLLLFVFLIYFLYSRSSSSSSSFLGLAHFRFLAGVRAQREHNQELFIRAAAVAAGSAFTRTSIQVDGREATRENGDDVRETTKRVRRRLTASGSHSLHSRP
jgi:hypothetical protein